MTFICRYINLPIAGSGGGGVNVVEGTETGKKHLDVWLTIGHRPTDPDDVSGELHLVVEFKPVTVCSIFPAKFSNTILRERRKSSQTKRIEVNGNLQYSKYVELTNFPYRNN